MPTWIFNGPRKYKNKPQIREHSFQANDFHKEPTKIIGGLGIFMVAIIANNPYVYTISLFIGGLLIASERFMINLAAIFKSDKNTVSEIPKLWVEGLGSEEIKKKQISEAEDVIKSDKAKLDQTKKKNALPKSLQKDDDNLVSKIRFIEAAALQKVESRMMTNSTVLKSYVRLRLNNNEFRFDAIGQDIISKKVVFALEVKYYSLLHLRSIERLVDRMRPFAEISPFPVILVVVYDDIQKELLAKVKDILPSEPMENTKLGIIYYQTSKDNKLKTINDARLNELLPGEFVPF